MVNVEGFDKGQIVSRLKENGHSDDVVVGKKAALSASNYNIRYIFGNNEFAMTICRDHRFW